MTPFLIHFSLYFVLYVDVDNFIRDVCRIALTLLTCGYFYFLRITDLLLPPYESKYKMQLMHDARSIYAISIFFIKIVSCISAFDISVLGFLTVFS
jgi:hypothetical protein